MQAACQAPAKLVVDESVVRPVALPAVQPGQPQVTSMAWLDFANAGNTSLAVSLQVLATSANVLQPGLWLDPVSSYSQTLATASQSCISVSGVLLSIRHVSFLPFFFSELFSCIGSLGFVCAAKQRQRRCPFSCSLQGRGNAR